MNIIFMVNNGWRYKVIDPDGPMTVDEIEAMKSYADNGKPLIWCKDVDNSALLNLLKIRPLLHNGSILGNG